MRNTFELSVKDVLNRESFQHAKVIAGKGGLNKLIRWVHILEVTEISDLLNGGELILTTGVRWKKDEQLSLNLLKQLINKQVTGLCIELGTSIQTISENIIQLANEHDFPLIVFKKEVRFIDITQDLNSLFIDAHSKMMLKLEAISNQFSQLLLSPDGFRRILRLLYQALDAQVAYVPVNGNIEYYPLVNDMKREKLDEKVKVSNSKNVINSSTYNTSKSVQALGHKFADLVIISQDQALTDFDYLVLDRAATALSQDRLRLLYVEEKRKHEEDLWLLEWLNGEHGKERIEQHLLDRDPTMKLADSVVCICEMKSKDAQIDLTYYSMFLRESFEQQGFKPLVTIKQRNIIFILINQREKKDWKKRLSKALKHIKNTELIKELGTEQVNFSVGQLYPLKDLHDSYQTAKATLFVKRKVRDDQIVFYNDLYIYRLILKLSKHGEEGFIKEFIHDYLAPVFDYDRDRNGEMFATLKVLLAVNGSRKEAAERLFIVRQTLYHRIETLKNLLGDDFLTGEKRLAIEVAVHAKQFVG